MDLIEAIRTRKSIRAFTSEPVSQHVLSEVLGDACRAPSAMNTQPWEFVVISGDVLDRIRQAAVSKLHNGEPMQPEHIVVGWPRESVYRDRQVGLAKQLFQLMAIEREDQIKRGEWMERGFRFFDAPAAIVLLTDRQLTEHGPLLDVGAAMQNICLSALNHGLGTCIEDQGVLYPEVVREIAGIPDNKRIIMSIAIGYPDWDFPANRVETEREAVENITTWVGF